MHGLKLSDHEYPLYIERLESVVLMSVGKVAVEDSMTLESHTFSDTEGKYREIVCYLHEVPTPRTNRGTQRHFSENISSEGDLRSRIFGSFVVKFLACLPVLGFSNILRLV